MPWRIWAAIVSPSPAGAVGWGARSNGKTKTLSGFTIVRSAAVRGAVVGGRAAGDAAAGLPKGEVEGAGTGTGRREAGGGGGAATAAPVVSTARASTARRDPGVIPTSLSDR